MPKDPVQLEILFVIERDHNPVNEEARRLPTEADQAIYQSIADNYFKSIDKGTA